MRTKLAFASVLVFGACSLLEYLEHAVLLGPIYATIQPLMRPSEETKTGLVILSYAVFAFFFVLIFSRWYRGKGLKEGVRFGVYITFFASFTYAYLAYATTPIPHLLALLRVLIGLIQNVAYGAIAALVFGRMTIAVLEPKAPVEHPVSVF